MKLQTLHDIDSFKEKTVLVRVDFNVPVGEDGTVKNDKRIREAIPTLEFLLAHGVDMLILMTHVGRPKNNEAKLKTNKIADRLADLMGVDVTKIDDWGEGGLPNAKIVMLENLRFNEGEKSKDPAEKAAFAKKLASLADIYVNEAFSNSHRDHASMTGVPALIPGVAGLAVEKEIEQIQGVLDAPKKPVVAVIAGAKADKLSAIKNLLNIADHILIGGALAYALQSAQGHQVGDTLIDKEGMDSMKDIVQSIHTSNKVLLPIDAVVSDSFSRDAKHKIVSIDSIEPGWMAVDIGPKTILAYVKVIQTAKTVFWFGPLGVFEWEFSANGTREIGEAIAAVNGTTIVGGGDSATAVEKFNLQAKMTHVSTGGGASLRIIEGKLLPAIEILKK